MTRIMHMSPLGPRQSGGLKGFGFTITFEPQAELTPPPVQSHADANPGATSFAGTEGDEGQHPHSRSGGALDARLPPKHEIAGSSPAQITNPACTASSQADEGSSNPQHPRAAPLYTSPEGPFHSITDWEDEDQ